MMRASSRKVRAAGYSAKEEYSLNKFERSRKRAQRGRAWLNNIEDEAAKFGLTVRHAIDIIVQNAISTKRVGKILASYKPSRAKTDQ
jgi:hypothetical protein